MKNLEDLIDLSPMQQGLLFESLAASESGLYTEQFCFKLTGKLDASVFQRSWQQIVERHGVLRTSFHWEDIDRPLQVVSRNVDLPWTFKDWCTVASSDVKQKLTEFLQTDGNQKFLLDCAPLMRCALIQIAKEQHYFVWTFHHLLVDGWSLPILFKECLSVYQALVSRQSPSLTRPRPYRDYILWLKRQNRTQAEAFWRQHLQGFAEPTLFTVPSPHSLSAKAYAQYAIGISPVTHAAVQNLARQHRLTLNTICQGAWGLLLSYYSGQKHVVSGVVVSDRPTELNGVENMIGLFINTLPAPMQRRDEQSVIAWLKQLQVDQQARSQFSYSSLVDIQGWSEIPKGTPMFDNLFVFENYPIKGSLSSAGLLHIELIHTDERTNYPLEIIFIPGPPLSWRLIYQTDRFQPDTIAQISQHLEHLLHSIAVNPNMAVGQLSLLNRVERQQLINAWSHNKTENLSASKCLHHLFEDQALRTPDAVALIFYRQRITYSELDRRANRVAVYLQSLGIRPEKLVGIYVERSPDIIVAMLGILKAGGAYLPLDPSYPPSRIETILQEAEVSVLLTQAKLTSSLPSHTAQIVCLDSEFDNSETGIAAMRPDVSPSNLAYVLFTSGSTGRPKGVAIEHHSPVALVNWANCVFTDAEVAGVLASTSICFDLSVFEIFVPLSRGGTVILVDNILNLPNVLAKDLITLINTVPSAGEALVRNGIPAGVQVVNLAGEPVRNALLKAIYKQKTVRKVYNLYGPSEDTTYSTFALLERDATEEPSIGQPIANTQVYIVDERMEPVPIGNPGELLIAGEGLARGYYKRPDLTADRFIANPFGEDRVYRTGDRVRYVRNLRGELEIEFLGRMDSQVKLRGFRIELGEIETCLTRYPTVREAVVTVRESKSKGQLLVAYASASTVVVEANFTTELQQFLRTKLPEYMVPAVFVLMDALPLTANGKIDRRALPDPEVQTTDSYIAPQTPLEKTLAQIWADVMGLEQVGIHDNFFNLGGDSIISIQVVSRVKQAGIDLTPKDLFRHQTVAKLAGLAQSLKLESLRSVTVKPESLAGDISLTPIQRWFFEHRTVNPEHFNQAVILKIRPNVSVALLQESLYHLMNHHDALRLCFAADSGKWRQWYADERVSADNLPFQVIDLSQFSSCERSAEIEARAQAEQESLNLAEGDLLRVILFQLSPDEPSILLWVIHHLAVDSVSWRILLEDLTTVYGQLASDQQTLLPPKTSSFKTWANWLTNYANSEELAAEIAYWQELLGSEGSTLLPLDYESGLNANTVASEAKITSLLSAKETQLLLQEVGKAFHTQVNDVLLSALLRAFQRWTHQDSLLLSLEGHGREELSHEIDLSRTVGWFTSLYPVHLVLRSTDPGETIKTIKEQLRRIPKRGIGYGIFRYLKQDIQQEPKFSLIQPQVSFNYLGQLDLAIATNEETGLILGWADERVGSNHSSNQCRGHLLTIDGYVRDGQLRFEWVYSSNLHKQETIQKLADNFIEDLSYLIAYCLSPNVGGRTPSDFPASRIHQAELDRFIKQIRNWQEIEDIYELSPLQQGLLFESLYRHNFGLNIEQFHLTLTGQIDRSAFRQAWQWMIERHGILRTSFHWEILEKPLQVVHQNVELPWQEYDWRDLSSSEQALQLAEFFRQDRHQGFTLEQAPLVRCTLIQVAETTYHFVWSFHHILLDGWSLPILFQELIAFYQAALYNQFPNLPYAPPYRDYIDWLQQQDLARAEHYWRQKLQGLIAPTPLVIDNKLQQNTNKLQENTTNSAYQSYSWQLSSQITANLKSLVEQHHLTLAILVQGVWALLWSHYSGDAEVVFGITISQRPTALPQIESMVGLLINTLPVRVAVPWESELIPWLQQLLEAQIEQDHYAYASLTDIQSWSEVRGGMPLFNTLVAFENYPVKPGSGASFADLQIEQIQGIEQTNYPLTAIAIPGDQLSFKLMYRESSLSQEVIQRMAGHLQTLLEEIANHPQQKLKDFPLLTLAERYQLLVEWNQTQQDYPQHKCIHQLFEEQVEQTPDAVAVVFEDQQLTYQELNHQANQLAHYLQGLGVGPEVLVGICVERSLAMVVGLLGILKAGGAYVSVDPSYPQERLTLMLNDAKIGLVLSQPSLLNQLPTEPMQYLLFNTGSEKWSQESTENPTSLVNPENPAYVIYTSGSTGQPKGVINNHSGVVNQLLWRQQTYGLTSDDRMLQKTPFSFDVSVWEFFWTLATGACLVIAKPEGHKDSRYLVELITREKITTLHFVPSMLQIFLLEENLEQCNCLKRVFAGGEILTHELQSLFFSRLSCELHNLYGPTEAAIDVTYWQCHPEEETYDTATGTASVPIGRPVANTQLYILNSRLEPTPLGVPGELHIGGIQVAQGYLNRPELTAQKFIKNPFGTGRLYKTGDLVRYLPDGNIEFLGRIDHQVKIRGFRIELGEIESTLSRHPNIQQTVVTVREDGSGQKHLVAYLVTDNPSLSINCLRQFLENTLPNYMIPSVFVTLDALPLTSSGKVDRKALPVPEANRAILGTVYTQPRTKLEQRLVEIWQNVLQVEEVGIFDNFFELGGNSIKAVLLANQLQALLSEIVQIVVIFDQPTVVALTEYLNKNYQQAIAKIFKEEITSLSTPGSSQENATPLSLIQPVPRTEQFPLSYGQQRIWFLNQLEGASATYNIPNAIKLEGFLNQKALSQALQALVQRHEVLRTNFSSHKGVPVQSITSDVTVDLQIIDLQNVSFTEQDAQVQELIQAEAQQPFNLVRDKLIRFKLLQLASTTHVLLVTVHHIIADGWSMGILRREFAEFYKAFCENLPATLPPLPIQYVDFVHWQRQQDFSHQFQYWKEHLAGHLPTLQFPTDFPRPLVRDHRGVTIKRHLDQQVTAGLQSLSQQEDSSLFMVLLAIWSILLCRYTGQQDIIIGTPIAARNHREVEGLIGLFLNNLALRINLSEEPTFRVVLRQVRETSLNAYANQDLSFEKLVEELQPERSLQHHPIFDVMLNVLNTPEAEFNLPNLSIAPLEQENLDAKLAMTLYVMENKGQLTFILGYQQALFSRERMNIFLDQYLELLQQVVAEPNRHIAEYSLVIPQNQRILPNPGVPLPNPSHEPVTTKFFNWVKLQPNHPAVSYKGKYWSYFELADKSSNLAQILYSLGIEQGNVVAVDGMRSFGLVVSLIGILMSGGTFLILDPNHPHQRRQEIIQISRPKYLLNLQPESDRELKADWKIIDIDPDNGLVKAEKPSANTPPRELSLENPAYIIFTSGSTGTPKGILGTHKGLAHFVHWQRQTFKISTEDRAAQLIHPTFDAILRDIFLPLTSGATLCIPTNLENMDGSSVLKWLEQEQITLLNTVPSIIRFWLLQVPEAVKLKSLRWIFISGEMLTETLINQWRQAFPESGQMINFYGATEVTMSKSFYSVPNKLLPGSQPAGWALPETQILIFNSAKQLCGIGEVGEVVFRTPFRTLGYINLPEEMTKHFVKNPYHSDENDLLYYTGDLGRYRPDGALEVLGRMDEQVKIRGVRVELGEIKSILSAHPTLVDAEVIARSTDVGNELVAYVILRANHELDTNSLRYYLSQRLPSYMVPSYFVRLATMPLTPNGKLDRRALPEPEPLQAQEFVAPRTQTEKTLVGIWKDVLNITTVSVNDNLFDLGGHSLLATQIVSRIRDVFNVEISLRTLFAEPIISSIGKQIDVIGETQAMQTTLSSNRNLDNREVGRL
jgi:amino acid adenylation domain-containing protein/non-ribosomal peptide synthase protein (TIGR01720 family)